MTIRIRPFEYAAVMALSPSLALPAITALVKDVGDREGGASSAPMWLGLGNRACFAPNPFTGKAKLIRTHGTHGTPASTAAVVTADELVAPRHAARIGGRLVFVGTSSSPGGSAPWRTDGTLLVTRRGVRA